MPMGILSAIGTAGAQRNECTDQETDYRAMFVFPLETALFVGLLDLERMATECPPIAHIMCYIE